nr:unnamed protein product [Spirometra erinaceieuropaei]
MSETPKHTNASIIPTTSGANTVDATSTAVPTTSNEDSLRTYLNSRGASTSRIGLVNYLRIHCTGLTNQGQHRIAPLVSTGTARIVTASEDLAACARMQIFGELQPLLNARLKWLTPSPEKPGSVCGTRRQAVLPLSTTASAPSIRWPTSPDSHQHRGKPTSHPMQVTFLAAAIGWTIISQATVKHDSRINKLQTNNPLAFPIPHRPGVSLSKKKDLAQKAAPQFPKKQSASHG